MKLLDRKTLETRKQAERKAEIDEGTRLAQSIDEMRRLKADEEHSLAEYRKNALRAVQGEIDGYLSERDGYRQEVTELQEARRLLLEPVRLGWNELESEREIVSRMAEELAGQWEAIDVANAILDQRELTVEKGILDAEEAKALASVALLEAQSEREGALAERRLAESEHGTQGREHEARTRDLEFREEAYRNGMDVNARDRKALDERENELITRESELQRRIENLRITNESINGNIQPAN